MAPAFKLFGLQRTCTNLMRRLMLESFEVQSVEAGTEWKHGWVEEPFRSCNGQPVVFLVCVKNPLAWFWSCFQYFQRAIGIDSAVPGSFRKGMPFSEFLRTPGYGFPNPVYRWNVMNRHWLTYLPRCFVVRHEDVLGWTGQVGMLRAISRRFQFAEKEPLTGIGGRVHPDMSVGQAMNREFYEARRYLQHYREADLEWLRNDCFWDAELLQKLEYSPWIEKEKLPLRS